MLLPLCALVTTIFAIAEPTDIEVKPFPKKTLLSQANPSNASQQDLIEEDPAEDESDVDDSEDDKQ